MNTDDVKALRQKAGLSVAEAARVVQIAERSWRRYETGERVPPQGLIEFFCLKTGQDYSKL